MKLRILLLSWHIALMLGAPSPQYTGEETGELNSENLETIAELIQMNSQCHQENQENHNAEITLIF